MHLIDQTIIVVYLAVVIIAGIVLSRRAALLRVGSIDFARRAFYIDRCFPSAPAP